MNLEIVGFIRIAIQIKPVVNNKNGIEMYQIFLRSHIIDTYLLFLCLVFVDVVKCYNFSDIHIYHFNGVFIKLHMYSLIVLFN